ncbi:MAG: hypothetical protein ABI120_11885 [Gemmatimonadaceae bacterium]
MPALISRKNRSARIAAASACIMLFGTLSACGGDKGLTGAIAVPGGVSAFSGDGQSATAGTVLSQALQVKVTTASGAGVKGATVNFAITSGSASLSATSVLTDSTGIARTMVTLGAAAGTVIVDATVPGTALSTRFTVTSTAGPIACTSPVTMEVGAATVVSGTSVCLTSTSSAEYALIPFNSSTTSTQLTISVQTAGITTVSADAPAANTASIVSPRDFGMSDARASAAGRQAFEVGLRQRERSALTSRFPGARTWYASRNPKTGARFNVIPATAQVGDLVTLNSNGIEACTKPDLRGARVMAVGRKAIVVADTLNPADGYTQAEFQSIATTFDDVVDATDTKAFGEPSDLDGNGHVVLYFTSAVNALTPKDASYYIGGFFYARDLFPTVATAGIGACAASNVAEMFYLLVPDPTGAFNGNVRTKKFITDKTIATVAHEYEHLINASRRLYVSTTATDFEVPWLDEGLAHMAEELLFYTRSGLSPKTNIDATLLRTNQSYVDLFNADAISNFGRLGSFISNPSVNSPYAANDSLATRGASWSFLRYAIDQQNGTQESLLYQIVNSDGTGLTNLRTVFGNDLTQLYRDWATSLLLDDVSGAAARYQMKSWNLSSIFKAIGTAQTYPISTQALISGTAKSVPIVGGGSAYLKFGVSAGATGALSWTAPADIQTTVVRLR